MTKEDIEKELSEAKGREGMLLRELSKTQGVVDFITYLLKKMEGESGQP